MDEPDTFTDVDDEAPAPLDPVPREEVSQEAETPAPQEEVVADAETPAEETPAPVQAESQPVESEQPSEETPVATETPAQETPMTQEEIQAALQQRRDAALPELAKVYHIDEELAQQIDDLEAKPSEYLPKLFAALHYNVSMAAAQQQQQNLPEVVQQISQRNIQAQRLEDRFYERHGHLKGREDAVITAIQQVRATNPKIETDALIDAAGNLATIALGLSAEQPASPAAPAPAAPTPTPAQAPETPPAPAMPIQPGGSAADMRTGPQSYEEEVFAAFVDEERNFGR